MQSIKFLVHKRLKSTTPIELFIAMRNMLKGWWLLSSGSPTQKHQEKYALRPMQYHAQTHPVSCGVRMKGICWQLASQHPDTAYWLRYYHQNPWGLILHPVAKSLINHFHLPLPNQTQYDPHSNLPTGSLFKTATMWSMNSKLTFRWAKSPHGSIFLHTNIQEPIHVQTLNLCISAQKWKAGRYRSFDTVFAQLLMLRPLM